MTSVSPTLVTGDMVAATNKLPAGVTRAERVRELSHNTANALQKLLAALPEFDASNEWMANGSVSCPQEETAKRSGAGSGRLGLG